MAYLVSNRSNFTIPADGTVDIRIELVGDTKYDANVWLQCIPCGDEREERKDKSMLECPSCGYEITLRETDLLATKHVDALRDRFNIQEKKPTRGFLWRFTNWYVSRKKLPAPKS